MNKTVNINLGGMFYHIDEDAYQKLTRYFEAIKRSLSNSSGQDEIIKDIEMRISELLSEKHKTDKQVISITDVDEVITVMGQPEDYRIDEDNTGNTNNFSSVNSTSNRKLYRDKDHAMIGGVLAGLGHYFGIDKVWLRVLFLIFNGVGLSVYIVLWIVMPEAKTTSEKLEMTGEPVTISNIEKKVREEFENVSDKVKNVNYDELGNKVKTGAEKIGSSLGDFIIAVLRIFSKIIGVFLIMTGLFVLVALFIAVFTLGSSSIIDVPWNEFIEAGNFTDYPVWIFGLIMFFAVGIPFFFLSLLGFKLLSPNLKSIGNIAKSTLLAIWIIAVALAIVIALKQASAFADEGRVVVKDKLNLKPTDTLLIQFKHNDFFAKDINDTDSFKISIDSAGKELIYSNNVSLKIAQSDGQSAYIQIEKEARGASLLEAKLRAEKIRYSYKIIGNQLVFDNYLLTDLKEKFRDQDIVITIFLPLGTFLKMDDSAANYDETDSDYFLWHRNQNEVFKIEQDEIRCQNCFDDNNENVTIDTRQEADSTVTTTVTVNGEVVKVKETTTTKGLSVDKDGVIIKNK